MLHIKDIEAFARINEALAYPSDGGSLFGAAGAAQRRLMNPALAFARFGSGMAAAPASAPETPPAPATTTAATSDEDEKEAERIAATTPSVDAIPLATAEVLPFIPRRRDTHDDSAAHAHSLARTGYDFDLMPPRPMTAFFNRFFFKR